MTGQLIGHMSIGVTVKIASNDEDSFEKSKKFKTMVIFMNISYLLVHLCMILTNNCVDYLRIVFSGET